MICRDVDWLVLSDERVFINVDKLMAHVIVTRERRWIKTIVRFVELERLGFKIVNVVITMILYLALFKH